MSRFADEIAQRKYKERKRRQELLYTQIAVHRMGSLTFDEQFRLNQFFMKAEPSEQELMEATDLIKSHIADINAVLKNFGEIPPDPSPGQE